MHYYVDDLTDPLKFQDDYPKTVHAMNNHLKKSISYEHYVRIRRECEYFWVQVRVIDGDTLTGEVYYKLGVNSYQIGDMLTFGKCYVFDAYDPMILNYIPGIDI